MIDRWALVVGGSGALGGGICEALAGDGWNIALTFRKNEQLASETAAKIEALGQRAATVAVDLEDPGSVGESLRPFLTNRELGAVVCAAGPHTPQRYVSEISWEQLHAILVQDVVGPFAVITSCLPALRASRGAIVALTTTAVERYAKRDFLSAAPKAAVQTLVRGLAVEEGRFGIRANCVAVGIIEAGLYQELVDSGDLSEEAVTVIRSDIPLPRLGAISDVAQAVRYLVSPEAGFVTGETVHVDGGRSV